MPKLKEIQDAATCEAYRLALVASKGNARKAAAALGVTFQAVYLAIRKYGLEDAGRWGPDSAADEGGHAEEA